MEVELITEGVSDDDALSFDQNNDDYLTLDGERCGICMDIVIDRGVLDCCQHWFCFTCIDNWATITNLCPLCQNEFQLITCVPVYDTIGSSKIDEELSSREDDWCIEGKTNTLLSPHTTLMKMLLSVWMEMDAKSEVDQLLLMKIPILIRPLLVTRVIHGIMLFVWDLILKGHVRIHGYAQVADAGETAVVVSIVGNQMTDGPSEKLPSTLEVDKDLKIERFEIPSTEKPTTRPVLKSEKLELCLSQDVSFSLPCSSLGKSELKMSSPDKLMKEPSGVDGFVISSRKKLNGCYSANEPSGSSLDLHLGLSVGCSFSVHFVKNDLAEDQAAGDMQQKSCSEEYLLPGGRCVPAMKDTTLGTTGAKRKKRDYRYTRR